ncbi:MAG: restriction endonuclease [Gulosibacter sp.]|uniref:restriction endonuclease n=1 Tax=Gulosibacter sp. TaxID=2817531 RepID=UPI003F8DE3A0
MSDGEFVVRYRNPKTIYRLVSMLRTRGCEIPYARAERAKLGQFREREELHAAVNSIEEILRRFQHDPYEFEQFCANVLRNNGLRNVHVTAAANDGGIDIRFFDERGRLGVVECKLYARANSVGRPLIQKLVGAQQHEQAERAIFMTSSRFTPAAVTYANAMAVELIDGTQLVELVRRAGMSGTQRAPAPANPVQVFTDADLIAAYPSDYQS